MTIPADVVAQVRRRARSACEYCGVTDRHAAGKLTVDHYRPQSKGGSDDLDNLIYCCFRCNTYKGDYWPELPDALPLWHPRRDPREVHLLELADGRLHPITPIGEVTLRQLRLNRPELVDYRVERRYLEGQARLLRECQELSETIKVLHQQYSRLFKDKRRLLDAERTLLNLLLGSEEE
jgi:hypothetical protein